MNLREKRLIGCRELISFPDWGIERIRAKTDTGARSSAVDVSSIELLRDNQVRFRVRIDRKRNLLKEVICPISRVSRVRSSNGLSEERTFVQTTVLLGKKIREVEVGLVCRKNMLCRVLVGRNILDHGFLIDTSKRYVTGKAEPKEKR